MLERGRGLCSLAFTAALIGVPIAGVAVASGHGDSPARVPARVTPTQAARIRAYPERATVAQVVPPQRDGPGGSSQGNGPGQGHGADSRQGDPGARHGRDTGTTPGGGPQSDGTLVPPGQHGDDHGRPAAPAPAPAPASPPQQPTPPAVGTSLLSPPPSSGDGTRAPSIPPRLDRGRGNRDGNGRGQDDGNSLGNGPGDAHGNGNGSTAPGLSGRGTGSSIPPACDGLCHNGQTPSLSPATPVNTPIATVNSTPTPTPSTPATPSSPAPVTPATPSHPSQPSGPHDFVVSKSVPVVAAGHGSTTGVGVSPVISPVFSAGAALRAAASSAGGLGALAPAAVAVAVHGAAGKTSAHHGAGGSHHSDASSFSLPPVSQAVQVVDKIINVVPTAVWLALAASLSLATLATGTAVYTRRRARRQASELAAVSAAAMTDPLTGVLNRRGFSEAVERELARARRYNRPFVLAYVDVRGLKNVNDTEGHLAGDKLLKSVAAMLTESARADDVVGRLGGDELGLLLVEQTPDAAKAVTRRIEAQVPDRRNALGFGSAWDLTIGSAAFPQDGQSFDELLATADRRLYQQRGIELTRA